MSLNFPKWLDSLQPFKNNGCMAPLCCMCCVHTAEVSSPTSSGASSLLYSEVGNLDTSRKSMCRIVGIFPNNPFITKIRIAIPACQKADEAHG